MSTQPLLQGLQPEIGTYQPSGPSDVRGPCPLVNSLANHGYIPRDGRNVQVSDLMDGLKAAGLSYPLRAVFAKAIYFEHGDPKSTASSEQSFFQSVWSFIRNPMKSVLAKFGMRQPGQKDSNNKEVLNLDQLALHGVIEHDVSLLRHDFAQGNNITPQPQLLQQLLNSSSDGKSITEGEFAGLRRRRIEQQKKDNPVLNYGKVEDRVACGEMALVLRVFGDGKSVPYEYARALFAEERLPVKEGWKKRAWWQPVGVIEFMIATSSLQKLVGAKF